MCLQRGLEMSCEPQMKIKRVQILVSVTKLFTSPSSNFKECILRAEHPLLAKMIIIGARLCVRPQLSLTYRQTDVRHPCPLTPLDQHSHSPHCTSSPAKYQHPDKHISHHQHTPASVQQVHLTHGAAAVKGNARRTY